MNKLRILLGSTLSVALLMLSPMAVLAMTGSDSSGSETTETPTTTSANDTTTKPTAEQIAAKQAELKKRLDEYKVASKTKVDEKTKKIIVAKCKPAQIVVKGANTSASSISESRAKAYIKISDRIQLLIEKVKAQGIDTTALVAANATGKLKADTLATSLKTYQQTLADLGEMDCATDPTGFQATLALARTQREAVKTQAQDLRTYISITLKDEIKAIKTQIQPAEDTKTGGNQ